MENIRHIHEVLGILYTTRRRYKIDELLDELEGTFGKDVQFASCAENIFDLSQVVAFLLSKNKIRLEEDIIIPITPACSH
jgi:probable metal-binding protein